MATFRKFPLPHSLFHKHVTHPQAYVHTHRPAAPTPESPKTFFYKSCAMGGGGNPPSHVIVSCQDVLLLDEAFWRLRVHFRRLMSVTRMWTRCRWRLLLCDAHAHSKGGWCFQLYAQLGLASSVPLRSQNILASASTRLSPFLLSLVHSTSPDFSTRSHNYFFLEINCYRYSKVLALSCISSLCWKSL